MNKAKTLQLIIFAGVFGVCGFSYAYTMLPQDRKFYEYKRAFREIDHPEESRFIATYDFLGAFDSQRVMHKETFPQGCDYIVGEIREYIGTSESIKTFYATQTIKVEGEERAISVMFIPTDQHGNIDPYGQTNYGPNGIRLLRRLASSLFVPLNLHGTFYFVSVWKLEFLNTDIRCLF